MATAAESEPLTPPGHGAKPPFLRRVRIRNYKSIAFCDVALEPLTVLVGRNGSGKSNFLDALRFVRDILKTNLDAALEDRGGWVGVLSRWATPGTISFELELAADPAADNERTAADYHLTITSDADGTPVVRESIRPHDRRGGEAATERSPESVRKLIEAIRTAGGGKYQHLDLSFLEEIGHDKLTLLMSQPNGALATGLRQTSFHNFDLRALRRPRQSTPGALLEDDARNLAGVVRRSDPDTLDRVRQFLSVIVPEVTGFDALPVGSFDTIRFWVNQGDGLSRLDFDAAAMSDGTLRALAALMAVYQADRPFGPHLVGIEEPETALHPAAASALVGALDEATLSTQVLITTHSADLLDHPTIRPENVRVVQMVDGRTVIGTVDEASREIVKDGLNTLGGLERDDSLGIDLDDLDRQAELSRNGRGPHE